MVCFLKRYQFHQIETPPPSGRSRHLLLPLVLFYPTFSHRGFFPPLRVTLTHFIVLSYEWALRLPTPFLISGLARLGVKPKLCRSSWRAFASTHRLMLPFTSSRETLLACLPILLLLLEICLPSRWSPPFLLHAPALISLFLVKVRLSLIFTLSPFTLWCSGQTALFLFLLAKAAPAYLPTAFSVALRPLFPFQPAQCHE